MKKTMFITSVIMVVVMAIALTTSSLAWFTATGGAAVTTNAMTIVANSTTSSGLQITDDVANNWTSTVSLASGNTAGSMNPLVPLSGHTNSEDDLIVTTGEGAYDSLLEALAQTADSYKYFIGNKAINDSGVLKYADTAYTTGFFTKDVYIASLATGEADGNPTNADDIIGREVYVQPSISFARRVGNSGDFAAYPTTAEAIAALSNEPTLMVAVLADSDDTDGNTQTWEVVQLFSSKEASATKVVSTLNVGKTEEAFANTQSADASYVHDYSYTVVNSGKTSTKLAKAVNGNVRGAYKAFRIVAWYDGASLNSNNNNVQIQFTLTFTAKAS